MAGRHQAHHSLGLLIPAHALGQLAAGLQPLASEPDLCAARVQPAKLRACVLRQTVFFHAAAALGGRAWAPMNLSLNGNWTSTLAARAACSRSSVERQLWQVKAVSRVCSEPAAACGLCWVADLRWGVMAVEGCSDVEHSSEVWPTGSLITEGLQVRPQITQRMPQLVRRQAAALLDLILYMAVACLPRDCGHSVDVISDVHACLLALDMLLAAEVAETASTQKDQPIVGQHLCEDHLSAADGPGSRVGLLSIQGLSCRLPVSGHCQLWVDAFEQSQEPALLASKYIQVGIT